VAQGLFVAYFRVSTERQGRSGLGLEAQREAVARFLDGGKWSLVAEYTEIETGKNDARPELQKALAACRLRNATLVVAKLDRLARNARFLLQIMEGTGSAGVVFCDLPHITDGPVGKFIVTQMAAVAELEAGLISRRTREALAAAKARGVKLGTPGNMTRNIQRQGTAAGVAARVAKADARAADLGPIIGDLQALGITGLRRIAAALNDRHIPAPRGGTWAPVQVRNLLQRLSALETDAARPRSWGPIQSAAF
jgi:DNA invertase Pin-like site-specific DNA recombinase